MAAVSFVSAGALSSRNSGGSLSVALPDGLATNDMMLMVAGGVTTGPAGWTSPVIAGEPLEAKLYWKRAVGGGSDVAPAIFAGSPQLGYAMGQLFAFRGVSLDASPLVFGTPSGASPTPAVTTASDDELVLWIYQAADTADDSGLNLNTPTASAAGLSSFTSRGQGGISHVVAAYNSNRYVFRLYTGVKSPAGSTGTVSFVNGNPSSIQVGVACRILPQPTPVSGGAFNRGFNEGFNRGFN